MAHIPTPKDLVERIDTYLKDAGTSRTAFGIRVAGDPNLVHELAQGRNVTLRMADKILTAIEGQS